MSSAAVPPISTLVQHQLSSPSPIRQIMKMAERQNIVAMGRAPVLVLMHGVSGSAG